MVAMLSMEDEAECPCTSGSASDASDASPTASSGASDRASAFKLSLAGSEASRLEEPLFQLDEDAAGAGARTPPRARSPGAPPVRLPPSRFAAEAAGKGGAVGGGAAAVPLGAPVTPAAAKGLSVSFVSPLSAGDADSLPASFDSLGLHDSPDGGAMSPAAPSSLAASSAFAGPASYAPSSASGGSAQGGQGGTGRRSARKHRSRRKLAIGSRLLKLTTQV